MSNPLDPQPPAAGAPATSRRAKSVSSSSSSPAPAPPPLRTPLLAPAADGAWRSRSNTACASNASRVVTALVPAWRVPSPAEACDATPPPGGGIQLTLIDGWEGSQRGERAGGWPTRSKVTSVPSCAASSASATALTRPSGRGAGSEVLGEIATTQIRRPARRRGADDADIRLVGTWVTQRASASGTTGSEAPRSTTRSRAACCTGRRWSKRSTRAANSTAASNRRRRKAAATSARTVSTEQEPVRTRGVPAALARCERPVIAQRACGSLTVRRCIGAVQDRNLASARVVRLACFS